MTGALRSNALRELEESAAADQITSPEPVMVMREPVEESEMDRNRQLSEHAYLRLKEIAERIGSTLGRTAGWVQRAPERRRRAFFDKTDQVRARFTQRTREMQQAARLRLQDARREGEQLVKERPLHLLAAIAATGFVVGVALRIVRSRHAGRH